VKNTYTKEYFYKRIRNADVRAQKLDDDAVDNIINDGFAEVSTIGMFFSDEEVISMKDYYANGELELTLDIEEDVTQVYDYYLTVEEQPSDVFYHGISKLQDSRFKAIDKSDVNSMWLDNRYNGRVHINLTEVKNGYTVDNAVIKYFYVPTSNTDTYYMDNQTRIATESAMLSAMYDYLHDIERAGQKRAAMKRQAAAIIPFENPEDLEKQYRSVFIGGGV